MEIDLNLQKHIHRVIDTSLFELPSTNLHLVSQVQFLLDQCMPGAINMKLKSLGEDVAEAEIPFAKSNRALHGFMHGGAYFTVGDTLTALMTIFYLKNDNEIMLTQGASIRYLRPVKKDIVKVKSVLKEKDNNKLYYICTFYNELGKRVAQAKYKYVIVSA